MNKLLVRASILSISLLTVMASAAISPALGKIKQAFPEVDPTMIKLVLTLPSLLIIPFSLLAGWLAARMKKKSVLLIGVVIYLIGGVGGAFARSITELLIIRGFFGIGAGLIIPLSTSLIADFYEGPERTKMMGLSGSVSHLGGVIFLLVAGWLSAIGWRYAFGVYGLALIIMLMIIFVLPEPVSKKPSGLVKSQLPFGIYLCAFLGIFLMVAFYAAPTNLAMFVENGLGIQGVSGYCLSAMTMVGVVAGAILATLAGLFGAYFTTVGLAAMAAGYALLGFTNSLVVVFIAMLCIGFSSGTLLPILLLRVAKLAAENARAFAMAVVSVGIYLGQFISPVVLKGVNDLITGDVFKVQFNFLAGGLAVATLVALFFAIKAIKSGEYKPGAQMPAHH